MAQLIPFIAGTALTIGDVAGAAATAAPIASSLASIGTATYGAVQAGKKPPDPMKKQRALSEQLLQQRASRGAVGQQGTLLTGASGLTNPANVGKKTLLGG